MSLVDSHDILELCEVLIHDLLFLLSLDDVLDLLVVVCVGHNHALEIHAHVHQRAEVHSHELGEAFRVVDARLQKDEEEVHCLHHEEVQVLDFQETYVLVTRSWV